MCFLRRDAAGDDGDEAWLLALEDDAESGETDRRARLRDGTVADRYVDGECEGPGRCGVRLGEPKDAPALIPTPPEARPCALNDGEAANPKPKEPPLVGLNGARDGLPKGRDEEEGVEGRPKPNPRGEGRGAEGKGRVEGGYWVSGWAMLTAWGVVGWAEAVRDVTARHAGSERVESSLLCG